jgi:MerR family transcriptional regulator/heat shock protein HspR
VSARRRRLKRESGDAIRIAETRGVFMISVAAELAAMHPQTLRMYEMKGLITPKRSPKGTRLYSQADVERLRKIQRLTSEEGLNLAGVETVLALEDRLQKMRSEVSKLRAEAAEMARQMDAEMERMRRSLRAEIVPYGAYEPEIAGAGDGAEEGTVKITVERPKRRRST